MRLLVAGATNHTNLGLMWTELDRKLAALPAGDTLTVVDGGDLTGVDATVRAWVAYHRDQGAPVVGETIRGDHTRYGGEVGPECSSEIVASGGDEALAFPAGPSPGTYNFARQARAAGILTQVIE